MAEIGKTYKVRYEFADNDVHQVIVTEMIFKGPNAFAVLSPPLGWPLGKSFPQELAALDAGLLEELVRNEATHFYQGIVVRHSPKPDGQK